MNINQVRRCCCCCGGGTPLISALMGADPSGRPNQKESGSPLSKSNSFPRSSGNRSSFGSRMQSPRARTPVDAHTRARLMKSVRQSTFSPAHFNDSHAIGQQPPGSLFIFTFARGKVDARDSKRLFIIDALPLGNGSAVLRSICLTGSADTRDCTRRPRRIQQTGLGSVAKDTVNRNGEFLA